MGKLMIACIRMYQRFLSPYLGRHCRFHPSCSEYAIEAIQVHGLVVGSGYTLWRIARCQPLCKGGLDPVPAKAGPPTEAQRDDAAR